MHSRTRTENPPYNASGFFLLSLLLLTFLYSFYMKKKIRVGVIFGGKSTEHEVSLQSAKNVIDALDKDKYEPVLIGIDKKGKWHLHTGTNFLLNSSDPKLISLNKSSGLIATLPEHQDKSFLLLKESGQNKGIDVVFPVLHGPLGEDGTIQGMLRLMDVPFVGSGVLGSAIGMDKEITKRLLRGSGIPIADFLVARAQNEISFLEAKKELGLPLFIKPANTGSSVGVSKVSTKKEFDVAVKLAFQFDRKIIIEEAIDGREIECSVLGNEDVIASIPGEIVVKHEFYSYEAKYIDEKGATLEIPAKLSKDIVKQVRTLSIATFKSLQLEGMARVDFFLKKNGELIVNEANTIPGFTRISMYPKLWEASGISYPQLLDKLIKLAIERHNKEKKLRTTY
jgi:D-alanine-D-alanine ligase